jgi:hypothetical protein
MVCRVHSGETLVTVPIVLNGDELQCVFITRKNELTRVGIFDANPRDVGPFWIFESYTRRTVPAAERERLATSIAKLPEGTRAWIEAAYQAMRAAAQASASSTGKRR